jgi:hypothetical protein
MNYRFGDDMPDDFFLFLGLLVMSCGGVYFWLWFFGCLGGIY